MAEVEPEGESLRRFEETLDLVDVLARQIGKVVGQAIELDELVSFGREGLLDAARRFDASRGVPFRAYANYRVRGAIYDGIRQLSRLPRRAHERLVGLRAAMSVSEGAQEDLSAPLPPGSTRAHADAALADHLAAMAAAMAVGLVATPIRGENGERTLLEGGDNPEEALSRAQLLTLIREAMADLPHQESELLRRHYLEGERFDHVAQELGVSKSWASRLHTRAIAKLAKRLRNQ